MFEKMAYLLAIPVLYYTTSRFANKIFDITSDYVLNMEELESDSQALLTATKTVLQKYKGMKESHPAFKSKILVENAVDSLVYFSDTTNASWFRRNYAAENARFRKLRNELEHRLRLFLLVV